MSNNYETNQVQTQCITTTFFQKGYNDLRTSQTKSRRRMLCCVCTQGSLCNLCGCFYGKILKCFGVNDLANFLQ